MFGWIGKGLRTGVLTTRYPRGAAHFQGWTVPGIDVALLRPEDCSLLARVCPTGALSCTVSSEAQELVLDYGRCISCGFCARVLPGTVVMTSEIDLSARDLADLRTTYLLPGTRNGC
ncbi:MAG: hypothetical protein ACR2JC_04820 [Chloroflexota bacterium]